MVKNRSFLTPPGSIWTVRGVKNPKNQGAYVWETPFLGFFGFFGNKHEDQGIAFSEAVRDRSESPKKCIFDPFFKK